MPNILHCALLMLVCTSALANKPNLKQTAPQCVPELSELPISFVESTNLSMNNIVEIHQGTAFKVGGSTWITASHVIGDNNVDVVIYTDEDDMREATVVFNDADNDVAVLYVADSLTGEPLPIHEIVMDAVVHTVGFPAYGGGNLRSFIGDVTGVTDNGVVTGSYVNSGMSGGPAIQCIDGKPFAVGMIAAAVLGYTNRTYVIDGRPYFSVVYRNIGESLIVGSMSKYMD